MKMLLSDNCSPDSLVIILFLTDAKPGKIILGRELINVRGGLDCKARCTYLTGLF
jgi:hypothetical protein